MSPIRSVLLLGSLVIALCPHPAEAFADKKTITATQCHALGPGTLVSELTFNSQGVFNPGDSNESVICPVVSDADYSWGTTPGLAATIDVFYRAGAVSGKVTCSAYTGSTVYATAPTFVITVSPAFQLPGARNSYTMNMADGGYTGGGPPTNVICTMTPKAALGLLKLSETALTTTP